MNSQKVFAGVRWLMGVLLILAGLSMTWAWGEVARLAEPPAAVAGQSQEPFLYAAWHAEDGDQLGLYRSTDGGANWEPLALPGGASLRAWAVDGEGHLAVAARDGSILRSDDAGESWIVAVENLGASSLLWDDAGGLFLGVSGKGIYRLDPDGTLLNMATSQPELAAAEIVDLSLAGDSLFAATPSAVYQTVDRGATWVVSGAFAEGLTAIEAIDPQTLYLGTATTGILKSSDAGLTWQPAWEGLGLAAGQMVKVTALSADPEEADVVYATVDHLLGGTQVHASAAGLFASADGGASWQPLDGPAFPEAGHATSLVLLPDKPLHAQVVTDSGLQAYVPDVTRILAGLDSEDAEVRASSARQLGLARPEGIWNELLAALDDGDAAVTWSAAEALGRINDPASVPGLLLAVEHPVESVRLGAAYALGMMRAEAAVEPLAFMLLRGEGLEVSIAGEALGRIGGPAATNVLLSALADAQSTPRWHAALAALEEMGAPAAEPLMAMLGSPDAHARRNAAQALGWVGSATASDALVRVLRQDSDAGARGQAAWALGEISESSRSALSAPARRALQRAQARDASAEVQGAAEWALSRAPAPPELDHGWAARWAPTLSQLQVVRWLVLALSLAGGAWLMMGTRSLAALPQRLRHRERW